MSPLVAMLVGIVVGALGSGVLLAASARRMRAALVKQASQKIAPVLERRALALGLPLSPSAEIGVGHDGELEVARDDELARLVRLAEAIDAQEGNQIGYVDTLRISKEEVDAHIEQHRAARAKG